MNTSIGFPNLNISFEFVGQSLSIRGFEITIYGLLVTTGMLLGLMLMIAISKKQKENPNLCLETMIPSLAGGIVGARLLYAVMNREWSEGKTAVELLDIRGGGLSVYGGILGAVILGWLFCKLRRISFAKMADIVCMGFLPVQIIGIWGNFFNREAFGEYTDSLFAMQLPQSAVNGSRITELMKAHITKAEGISWIQVHPLFLYESLWCLLMLVVLLFYTWRKKYQGEIFLRYLAGYSLGRAAIEWLRPGQKMLPGTELPILPLVLAALFVLFEVTAAVRRSLSKKREKYIIRRNEERKRNPFNYADAQNFEDVSHEFLGSGADDEKPEEKEVSEDAEKETERDGREGDQSEKKEETEEKNTELQEKAQRDDQQQERSSEVSEDKPEAGPSDGKN